MLKPPYIPPPRDYMLEVLGTCQYCGGPVDLMIDQTLCCRCCESSGKSLDAMGAPPPPRRVETPDGDHIAKYMRMLDNGYAMRLMSDGNALELENFAHITALNQRLDKINICVLMSKPGAAEAVGIVEANVFPSNDTVLNNAWEVRIMQWEGFMWQVLTIDEKHLDLVSKFFLMCGFRIVDGIPTLIDHHGTRQFPIHTSKTFTLENLPPEEAIDVEIAGGMSEDLPSYPAQE